MRVITDPDGVFVNGKRYEKGTPLEQVDGYTDAHLRIWERFGQVTKAGPEEQSPEGGDKPRRK